MAKLQPLILLSLVALTMAVYDNSHFKNRVTTKPRPKPTLPTTSTSTTLPTTKPTLPTTKIPTVKPTPPTPTLCSSRKPVGDCPSDWTVFRLLADADDPHTFYSCSNGKPMPMCCGHLIFNVNAQTCQ